jgi:putative spermidine/putrescine transport system permease protein
MTTGRQSIVVPVFAWIVLLYLALPILVVFPVSLTDAHVLALPKHSLSLAHWVSLFSDPKWLEGFKQSFFIGVSSAAIAAIAGTLCAIGCWRLSTRWSEAIKTALLVPIIVPAIVYAIALYRYYAELRMLGTFTGVILAHAVLALPYVMIAVSASLANFDRRLVDAARNLGANTFQVILRVIVPNIWPGILSGAVLAFVLSWDELVVVLFIASRTIYTLPRLIWDGINESLDPKIAVVAAGMIGVTILLFLAQQGFQRSGMQPDNEGPNQ